MYHTLDEPKYRPARPLPRPYDLGKIEDRQTQGLKLASYLGTVTGDPHADALMTSGPVTMCPRKTYGHVARTAKTPRKLQYQ